MTPPEAVRLAGAPISWGVCEVPGWGHQMAPQRVLEEMREAGLAATELGPPGFLPRRASELAGTLAGAGLRLVGGFVAAVLHQPARRPVAIAAIAEAASTIATGGGEVLVLAASSADDGYDSRETLDASAWAELARGIEQAAAIAGSSGLTVAFHPHAGTVVERADEVRRLLEVSPVGLCLDTGHLLIGGADPVQIAAAAAGRIVHAHLKDVDASLAERVRSGRLRYSEAVAQGLYRALGDGDVDVSGLLHQLRSDSYGGWYVLEQDVALAGEPDRGEGPLLDAGRSVARFNRLAAAVANG